MNLVDELHAICRVLGDAFVPYAVCGGVAVSIHGAPRTTKDIDLLVDPSHVPQVISLIASLAYTIVALPMTFDAGTDRERHVQRVSKLEGGHHLVVDLMFADAAFTGFLSDRVEIDLPAGRVSVVSLETLVKMKRLAGRTQDLADLEKLEKDGA